MSKIFISYRREDTKWAASTIYSELSKLIGEANVFFDIDNLAIGKSFVEGLNSALDQCEVTFVLIGESWLRCCVDGVSTRRLDDPKDIVRMEIARSLERGIPVVPICIDNAQHPSRQDLPEEINELSELNGRTIHYHSYRSDIRSLVDSLRLSKEAVYSSESSNDEVHETKTLREILLEFLSAYSQWSFSSTRIYHWGAKQVGFECLSNYSIESIREELKKMRQEKVVETRISKKGGTLYKVV